MSSPVCPRCGSAQVIPIAYGLPGPELERRALRGEVELGGCMVAPGQPLHRCIDCGLGFGSLELPGDERKPGRP